MFYKNKHFTLNTETREVFDENGKPSLVTGNAYRLLEFLCDNKRATLTDIIELLGVGDYFDDNNARQLKLAVKKAIGYEVILYEKQRYFIDGEVIASEKNEPLAERETAKNKKIFIIFGFLLLLVFLVSVIFLKNKKTVIVNMEKPKSQMTIIPAGDFVMGSTEEQAMTAYQSCQEQNQCMKEDYLAEYPSHTVNLPNFYIDTYEVSNVDYSLFVKANNRSVPQYFNNSNLNQPNQPVVGVNWNDATAYCAWLGKRLPTEAEWEKSTQGSSKGNHGKGGMPGLDDSDGYEYTAPVATSLGVSSYGVFNMTGNVAEWTSDTFASFSENKKFNHPLYGQGLKVIKGGAYDQDQTMQRPATRDNYEPGNSDIDLGFRCAKSK